MIHDFNTCCNLQRLSHTFEAEALFFCTTPHKMALPKMIFIHTANLFLPWSNWVIEAKCLTCTSSSINHILQERRDSNLSFVFIATMIWNAKYDFKPLLLLKLFDLEPYFQNFEKKNNKSTK